MKIEIQEKPSPVLVLEPTEEARRAHFLETGKTVSLLVVHTEDADAELRQALTWLGSPRWVGEQWVPHLVGRYCGSYRDSGLPIPSVNPTPAQVVEAVQTHVAALIANWAKAAEQEIAKAWAPGSYPGWAPQRDKLDLPHDLRVLANHPEVLRLRPSLEARLEAAIQAWKDAEKAWEAEEAPRREAAERAQREEAERVRAQEKAAEEARAAWVAAHGSERLQKALSQGYSCSKLLATEMAAHFYPGYVLDWGGVVVDKSRACPSLEALNLAEEAEQQGGSAIVVWIPRQEDLLEGLASGEAVRVRDSRITNADGIMRDLYRMI